MKHIFPILTLIIFSACNSDSDVNEKENELLKKEIELMKKEQEINSRQKPVDSSKNTVVAKAPKDNSNWINYNHPFGYEIELPSYFEKSTLTATGIQYFTNNLSDEIELNIQTIDGGGSYASLTYDYQENINTYEGIDYKILKDTWFVVSGTDENGIYYIKEIIKKGRIHHMTLRYPVRFRDIFDSILPRIVKSFR